MSTGASEPRYAVVARDAGGAEILSSLVSRSGINALLALDGPAVAIFARKLPGIANYLVDEAIAQADAVLCGTSLSADWERHALALAKAAGKLSISVLDHWINYRERFETDAGPVLPDEIWTVDAHAYALATQVFPECRVVQIENHYKTDCLDEIAAEEAALSDAECRERPGTVLYVTQPTSEHALRRFGDARHWGYTETEALTHFLVNFHHVAPQTRRVVIRPHPDEISEKYAHVNSPDLDIKVRSGPSLAREIAAADVVAGCNTMAMVVASWAGRKVVCTIPPGGRDFRLPIASVFGVDVLS